MATYFVSSAGSNTSPYDTWAKAATNLTTALAAATADGDIVVIQYDGVPATNQEAASTQNLTAAAAIKLISASNDGGSAYTPTPMGTGAWIGSSTLNVLTALAGTANKPSYVYGLTLRVAGAGSSSFNLAGTTGNQLKMESCYFWCGTTAASNILVGPASAALTASSELVNCTVRFGAATQTLQLRASRVEIVNLTISTDGVTPNLLLSAGASAALNTTIIGSDLSNCTNIVGNASSQQRRLELRQCKIPATPYAAQTTYSNTDSQLEFFAWDCSTADTHYSFIYANGLGEVSAASGGSEPYITADGATWETGGSKLIWKIVTNAGVRFGNPFRTPWIPVHNEAVASGLTPHLEALRKGSSTAYKESELWSEWTYKGTSGSTVATLDISDRGGVAASTTDQAASALGAGDWTNEDGAANAYHKLGPAAAITPQELGDICARVSVAVANATVYVDPVIRGLA